MSNEVILTTGASGGAQGQTGRHVTEMLLKRGARVRAFVHRIDERSDRLRALGAEVVEGDFLDIPSVQRAVRGVSRVFFAYPVQAGLMDAAAIMAAAAREAGVTRLVNSVMLRSSLDAPTPRMRQNYLAEQVFDWAGVGAVHVRATIFCENVRALVAASVPHGVIRLPWGPDTTKIPLVAAVDVARVTTALLAAPSVPSGAYRVIGNVLTVREIADIYGRALARDVRYQEISDDEWKQAALGRGLNAHAADHLSLLWRALREAAADGRDPEDFVVPDTIERWGGVQPTSFEAFVREVARIAPAA